MKFAHISDVHIGGWRESKLTELGILAFENVIEICIKENTAFLLIAGDLFNTSMPSIDLIKRTASILKKLKNKAISCYIIPGSHDYSPSGKTMLDVLEKAGLVENVVKLDKNKLKFTLDKTGIKITGLYGKKGALESFTYKNLDKKNLEQEKGFKIFMFHTLLNELKPKDLEMVEADSISILPKNFDYYAGGHPHFVYSKKHKGYGIINYPGPLFPNNFKELEELKNGGMYLVEVKGKETNIKHIPIKIKDVLSFDINADNKNPKDIEKEVLDISKKNVKDKIVTLRIAGILREGKPSDINFNEILNKFDVYYILKNTTKLKAKEFEDTKTSIRENIEEEIINENLGKLKIMNKNEEKKIILELINILNKDKNEGETNVTFENRIIEDVDKILKDDN